MSEFPQKTRAESMSLDPMDIEIRPGVRIRDLQTVAECASAVMKLQVDMGRINSQIAEAEANPASVVPGWRTRAQGAMRWKKQAIKALNSYASLLGMAPSAHVVKDVRSEAILRVIREDIGEVLFEKYREMAERRYPEAFAEPVEDRAGEVGKGA